MPAHDLAPEEDADQPLGATQGLWWFLWLVIGAAIWTGMVLLLLLYLL